MEPAEPETEAGIPGGEEEPQEIYIDVCGAVSCPGVYILPEGSRVFRAIEAAGGFTEEAARASVNQAAVLQDAMKLYVPTEEEVQAGGTAPDAGGTGRADDGRVNLNTAGMEELCGIPGIGKARASDILAYREQHGSFSSIEELMQISGIKEGTFSKIRDLITVD